jgi:hypothetical protein
MTDRAHEVGGVEFAGDMMIVTVDGDRHVLDLAVVSKKLLLASNEQRRSYVISPSGYGIHWPLVDEDLTVDGLLRLAKPEEQASRAYPHASPGRLMAVSDQHASYGTKKSRRSKRGGT